MNLFARFWNWIKRMFMVNHLSGFGAGGGLTLTQKGYGISDTGGTGNITLNYSSVSAGAAPAAGDLVVWMVAAFDDGAQPINDVSGSGWTQSRAYVSTFLGASILAKVVTAGDISSPATIVTSPTDGASGTWVAYSLGASISSLSVSSLQAEFSDAGGPSSDAVNSTGIGPNAIAITTSFGTGSDDDISLSWSGATPDIQFQRSVLRLGAIEVEYAAKKSVGGVSVTVSKSDDGTYNSIATGYVTVA